MLPMSHTTPVKKSVIAGRTPISLICVIITILSPKEYLSYNTECNKSSLFTLLASKNLNYPTLASVHINMYFFCTMYEIENYFLNKMFIKCL